ncbi:MULTISPECIES: type I methionyl aminopeptidase [unclassified Schlesneria]|uniref:type I methionyl aminopeptidase n=1 Tax=unclassified Schlesneria TaxID=2762017 RepID=UPI002EFF55DC
MNVLRRKPQSKCPLYLKEEEQEGLRAAGRFNAELMDHVRPLVKAGVTTLELDKIVYEYTMDHGHIPACLGYKNYPNSLCASVNEVVCHGIPNKMPLRDGDIVNIDLTTIVDGWHGDSSETFLIGNVSQEARRLVQVTFDSMYLGIQAIQPFGKISDIGHAIERFARANGLAVVQEYQGHGLGREFHQEPGVPHYVPRSGAPQVVIEPGMCFTVEPMLNLGTWRTMLDTRDKWTVRTMDLSLSAQFEHTLLITESGPEILTQTKNGPQVGHKF